MYLFTRMAILILFASSSSAQATVSGDKQVATLSVTEPVLSGSPVLGDAPIWSRSLSPFGDTIKNELAEPKCPTCEHGPAASFAYLAGSQVLTVSARQTPKLDAALMLLIALALLGCQLRSKQKTLRQSALLISSSIASELHSPI
jgi:hypothetical protein